MKEEIEIRIAKKILIELRDNPLHSPIFSNSNFTMSIAKKYNVDEKTVALVLDNLIIQDYIKITFIGGYRFNKMPEFSNLIISKISTSNKKSTFWYDPYTIAILTGLILLLVAYFIM